MKLIHVLTSMLLMLPLSPALAGGQDAGGGHVYEAEFMQIGRDLVTRIGAARLTSAQIGFELINLDVAVREVQILATDDVQCLHENVRMAINSPAQRLITVSASSWAILDKNQKDLLVLHEYLRFVSVDDSQYSFSLRIMELLTHPAGRTSNSPSARTRVYEIIGFEDGRSTYRDNFIRLQTRSQNTSEISIYAACTNQYGYPGGPELTYLALVFITKSQSYQVLKNYESNSRCRNVVRALINTTPDASIFLTIDPVRALSNPNDLVTLD